MSYNLENDKDLRDYYAKVKFSDVTVYDEKHEDDIIHEVVMKYGSISHTMAKNRERIPIISAYFFSLIYDGIAEALGKYDPENIDNVLYINSLVSKVLQRLYGYAYYLSSEIIEEHNNSVNEHKVK